MTAPGPGALQSLVSFTVTASYHRHETTFDVWPPGRRDPVARLYKEGPVMDLQPFRLLTGSRLNEPAGQVSRRGAWDTDGTQIGVVLPLSSKLQDAGQSVVRTSRLSGGRWRAEQPGLPVLTGRPAGLTAWLRFNPLTNVLLISDVLNGQNFVDYLLPFRFRFTADGVAGFELSRSASRSRLLVAVHDRRIDRRLVLACVVSVHSLYSPTLRQTAINFVTNPLNIIRETRQP